MSRAAVLIGLSGLAALIAGASVRADVRASLAAAAGHEGAPLFEQYCFQCHGPDSAQAYADLSAAPAAERSIAQLRELISKGRPEKGMPAFGAQLSPLEVLLLVEYLHVVQGRPIVEPPERPAPRPPDPRRERGLELFRGKARCAECHSLLGEGGFVGPDLSGVGKRLKGPKLRRAVLRPSARIAGDYRAVVLETRDGRRVRGRGRNETPETIQVLDESGELWTTWFKADLRSFRWDDRSLMPDDLRERLSQEEFLDLMYLLRRVE